MDPLIGEIKLFAGNYPPLGWMFCNGQLLGIQQYTALYAVLGTRYGGNGTSTFALPNMQGAIPMNYGAGPGLTNRNMGTAVGTTTVTLTASMVPAHTHLVGVTQNPANSVSPAGTSLGFFNGTYSGDTVSVNAFTATAPTTATKAQLPTNTLTAVGNGAAHSNMQPTLTLSFIIATEGNFPVRN